MWAREEKQVGARENGDSDIIRAYAVELDRKQQEYGGVKQNAAPGDFVGR
jgi:hypothetical protein